MPELYVNARSFAVSAHEVLAFYPSDRAKKLSEMPARTFRRRPRLPGRFDKVERFWRVMRARQGRQAHTGRSPAGLSAALKAIEVVTMPEIIFTGSAGRIEGRYHPSKVKNAPIAIVLHPHPQFGGTMNHPIIYQLYYAFAHRNLSVLRFNFRGVGRSPGSFDHGQGELADAASALDWAQSITPEARGCWIAGFSFGAWIGMQLLMRRPEIEGFISIAPPANLYDFSFLAPCPSSGLIIHGDKDAVVPYKDVVGLVEKLKTQKGIVIDSRVVASANHFFDGKIDALMTSVMSYLDKRLEGGDARPEPRGRRTGAG